MIWAYLGKPELQPDFPDFEWFKLPSEQCAAFKVMGECNYAQLVEGTIDTAHAGVLHRKGPWGGAIQGQTWESNFQAKLELEYTSYGFRYAGVRQTGENSNARVTPVIFPYITLIPNEGGVSKSRRLVNAFVPRDDESTWVFQFVFDREKPVDVPYRIEEGGLWVDEHFRKLSNSENWYKQDRAWMKEGGSMSGIRGILVQDHAVAETQGKILDRSKEFLGTSDLAVTAWRRQMIKSARALRDSGAPPPGTQGKIPYDLIRSEALTLAPGETWQAKVPLPDGLVLQDD
jgi:hypothetical protein